MARPRATGLPRLPTITDKPRPLPVRKHAIRPTGPRVYGLSRKSRSAIGFGDPPAEFLDPTYHGSGHEWIYYWALSRIFRDPPDPRKPPYEGGKLWQYQVSVDGTFIRSPLSSVLDFLVLFGGQKIGLRIQTERYHVFADAARNAQDYYLKFHSAAVDRIMDLHPQYVIADETGQAAIKQVARALSGQEEPNPEYLGLAERVRP